MIERLQASITHCESKRDLNQSSNHISIFTIFTLKIEQTSVKKRRTWKKIDSERLTSCLRALVVSTFFNNVKNIETFVRKIQLNVQSIIQKAIFMIKESERAQLFWSFKCSEVVTTTKRKRKEWSSLRIEKNWKTYLKFIDVKKKVIVKKKKLKFKKIFEKFTIQTTSFWRFVRWAKLQSHRSKKILKISNLIQKNSLKETTRVVKSFENKANMLTKQFFSETTEADLNDMTSFNYRDVVVKTTLLISEDEIRQIINKCKFDSVSNSNEISNRILKILIKKLLSSLTSLFRACVEHNYHLLCFREVNIITLKKIEQKQLHRFQDIQTHRIVEHDRQSIRVYHCS
jgi:plasmid maintenance system killer protein